MDELPLFPVAAREERWHRLRAAAQQLATQGILIGTSSWKYPGWIGWLYDRERYLTRGKFSEARFERECLREYAEVFSTVSVDAGYYTFPTQAGIEKLCAQVPDTFRLSFKVTDEITLRRFPRLDRFGARAGTENPRFLDAHLFRHAFLTPLESCRHKIGVLMFEFTRFAHGTWPTPADFANALDEFFSQLPGGWQYGVELRNPELLDPAYLTILHRHGVTHILNNWQAMPSVGEQLEHPGILTTDFTAARFLLKPGRSYEQAVDLFSPYATLREPLPEARAAARRLIATLISRSPPAPTPPPRRPPPSYIFVN
ncbi:MAG: DUF72 domain-containing protein, partial [Verrucomicrobiales bacterium]